METKEVLNVAKITVCEAAKKMNVSSQFLRFALRDGKFPFGTAVKTSENRYVYYINDVLFNDYLKGDLSHE